MRPLPLTSRVTRGGHVPSLSFLGGWVGAGGAALTGLLRGALRGCTEGAQQRGLHVVMDSLNTHLLSMLRAGRGTLGEHRAACVPGGAHRFTPPSQRVWASAPFEGLSVTPGFAGFRVAPRDCGPL